MAINDLTARIANRRVHRNSRGRWRAGTARTSAGVTSWASPSQLANAFEPIEQLDRVPVVVRGGGVEQVEAGMVADPEELGHGLNVNR